MASVTACRADKCLYLNVAVEFIAPKPLLQVILPLLFYSYNVLIPNTYGAPASVPRALKTENHFRRLSKVPALFRFPSFLPFSVSGFHLRYHIAFISHVSLAFLWLWQFLRLSSCLTTLVVLRSTGQKFGRVSLSWDLYDVFFMIRLGFCVLGEGMQRTNTIFIPWYQGHLFSAYLVVIDV